MARLEEIGVEEMRQHLRVACAHPPRENFFDQVVREQSQGIDPKMVHGMRNRLREACSPGAEDSLVRRIVRRLTDPIRPVTERGRWRPHPMLLLWGGTALLAAGIFFYWSFS
jgi:hypothetical protein